MGPREGIGVPHEVLVAASTTTPADSGGATRRQQRDRLGGTEGNEILTSVTAAALTLLLIAEGLTILDMGGLLSVHMFIGMVLIPPVLLKLASTGYRFARYYTGKRAYREKGPPLMPLRVIAPLLVATTAAIFITGVWLLLLGHRSGLVLELHKVAFIVWGLVFAVHFLAYIPRVVRSLRADWKAQRRQAIPGAGARGMLIAASLGGGLALALALVSQISGWHSGHPS